MTWQTQWKAKEALFIIAVLKYTNSIMLLGPFACFVQLESLFYSAVVLAAHCTLDSIMLQSEKQKNMRQQQWFPSSVTLISMPRKKRRLATDVQSMAPWFEVSLIARVEPTERATVVSSRAAEMEAWLMCLGWGRLRRPTQTAGSHRKRFRGAFVNGSFQDMKVVAGSYHHIKCFKAFAPASPPVETNKHCSAGVIISVGLLCLA